MTADDLDEDSLFTGRMASLRPLLPEDYAWVVRLCGGSSDVILRYRSKGKVLSADALLAALWSDSFATFVIQDKGARSRAGIISIYGYEPRNGTAMLAAVIDPEFRRAGWPGEALPLVLRYIFVAVPIRKICVEATVENLSQFGSIGRSLFVQEGVLRQHEWYAGAYRDVVLYSVFLNEFEAWCGEVGWPKVS